MRKKYKALAFRLAFYFSVWVKQSFFGSAENKLFNSLPIRA
jgi:hypothetical protein